MNLQIPFHPAVADWFAATFAAPTPAQVDAWPAIQQGRDVLIAAPTGSGKTLAAFLAAIDDLVREGEQWGLPDETRILYVSPLKALSNDISKNLEAPLAGIRERLRQHTVRDVEIRSWVRTGDTPQAERVKARKRPPHIVVTTPESLYILLGSTSGREMLGTVRTVIVDEIHAVAGNKRGLHLCLSLERLEALTGRRVTRIGLSATQRPIEEVAKFLVGTRRQAEGHVDCTIVDSGHVRQRDLALELPDSPLEAVMSNDVWSQLYDRLAELVRQHRTTLVFVNTRRLAERVCRHVGERLDADEQMARSGDSTRVVPPARSSVAAHHGSLAKEQRFDAEQRLKRGELKALIATASLELGIDIGDVDLVCQISSPRSINAFLQRVGRSGHAVGGTPKGRLFPLSRDDLVECTALLDSVRRAELDRLKIPQNATDVLAQHIVAEVAARECRDDELYALLCGAYPYRNLPRTAFDAIVHMLAEGFTTRRGRHGALIYHDAVNHLLRGRAGARLTAITSAGAIPDTADYQVRLEPEGMTVGSVNEDFAVESLAGDVFQLGNRAYRIIRVERSTVRVEDARGQAPNIPFWLGEAPGRTDELSVAVSRLRDEFSARTACPSGPSALALLKDDIGLSDPAAAQLHDYLAAGCAALGCLPTQQTIVFERFFDEAGGMQLVIHSPFGSRINRAWGLALRKRFCRSFNFELQAAATEDAIVLSLTTAHSFELADVARYLHPNTAREILIQALLDAPMFTTRWRWSASIALALPRFRGGKKVPAPLMRMNAEDLLASVFPDQVACGENLVGDIVVPDHPLVQQTLHDCLEEAMDIDGFERLLVALNSGAINVVARDLTEPSPLALEVLSARPYAYLDDAPLEERRTQAVASRRWMDPESAAAIGKLDREAIARVRSEAWPDAATADQLHDALLWLTFMTRDELRKDSAWPALIQTLITQRRVVALAAASATAINNAPSPSPFLGNAGEGWEGGVLLPVERLPLFKAVFPDATFTPSSSVPTAYQKEWSREAAMIEIVRGRLEGVGPTTAVEMATSLSVGVADIDAALLALEAEGSAMRGRFTSEPGDRQQATGDGQNPDSESFGLSPVADRLSPTEWCDRRLLARIHRYTVKRLRAEIEPVQARDFLRFLLDWQRVTPSQRMQGPDAIASLLSQLEGFDVPAAAWETEVLPARMAEYDPAWLDEQCLAGRMVWTRLAPRTSESEKGAAPVRSTPIALLARRNVRMWSTFAHQRERTVLTAKAQQVFDFMREHGASFFDELVDSAGLMQSQVEEALAELVALGLVNSDSFGGLRALLLPADKRKSPGNIRRRGRMAIFGMQDAGRWTLVRRGHAGSGPESEMPVAPHVRDSIEHICHTLLRRWGVVFWKVIEREANWLPPWRDLLQCFRRLEDRGDIRGGRFVTGFSGEQFALPDALGPLREARRRPGHGELISLSAADPLNLVGILTPGARLPALTGNRLLYRDGLPIALYAGGEVRFMEALEPKAEWDARNVLLRRPVPASLSSLS